MADEIDYEESAHTRPLDEDELEAGPSGVSLLIVHGLGGQLVPLGPDDALIVGRAIPADILVKDKSLSREHARFQLRKGQVWVEDLDSTNGTRLAGKPVASGYILPGMQCLLGHVRISVQNNRPDSSEGSKLLGHDDFRLALSEEIFRAHRHGRNIAIVHLQSYSPKPREIADWYGAMIRHLGPLDRTAIYSNHAAEILLPESDATQAAEFAKRILKTTELIPVKLRAGIAVYPDSGMSGDALVECSRRALSTTQANDEIKFAPSSRSRSLSVPTADDAPVAFSTVMRELLATAARLATATIPVLVVGETGTGKELVAKAIHQGGTRSAKRLCSVNCGAIPRELVESVLFGHQKGAFTGAHKDSLGVFREAHGGTLFLDEIGELPLAAQVALLRVLESKKITPVGATEDIPVDVRIIAATHRDLKALCQSAQFRDDLYYRLNGMTLRVPPLREHAEDVQALVDRFLAEANRSNQCTVPSISNQAMHLLIAYHWPGNIRELRNVIERAVVLAGNRQVEIVDLPNSLNPIAGEDRLEQTGELDLNTMDEFDRSSEGSIPDPVEELTFQDFSTSSLAAVDDDEDLDFKTRMRLQMEAQESQLIRGALEKNPLESERCCQIAQDPGSNAVPQNQTIRHQIASWSAAGHAWLRPGHAWPGLGQHGRLTPTPFGLHSRDWPRL